MRLECFVFTSCCLTSLYGCAAPFTFVPISLLIFDTVVESKKSRKGSKSPASGPTTTVLVSYFVEQVEWEWPRLPLSPAPILSLVVDGELRPCFTLSYVNPCNLFDTFQFIYCPPSPFSFNQLHRPGPSSRVTFAIGTGTDGR